MNYFNLTWVLAIVIALVLAVYTNYWIIKKTALNKLEPDAINKTSHGLHFALLIITSGILVIDLPGLVMQAFDVIYADKSRSVATQSFKMLAFIFGTTVLITLSIYFVSYGVLKLLYPKSIIRFEIEANNVGYILQLGSLMIILAFILQDYNAGLLRYFLPQPTIPFYR